MSGDKKETAGEREMKVLGITGGVGAGKSTVLGYLADHYGARVIEADRCAHLLQQPGGDCYDAIVNCFGREILFPDGRINREILGKIVYADQKQLKVLNRIVHPAVKTYIIEIIAQERKKGAVPFVTIEAALLLEDGYDQICDEIWYIYADEAARTKRLQSSRGYSPEKIRSVMANQRDEEGYRSGCKLVIDNSSDFVENTYEQIDKGLREHGFL
ncbi:MAG: dephospho-CoA kinase [Lachnospiraceae bacterium]|nr:dephospho-CoA kinase [Lachnospiraceae bacterium]